MKLKLIDIEHTTEEVQFGTCELCFSTGTVDNPVFVFQRENGERISVIGYSWSWGDYEWVDVDNMIDFAAYINEQEFEDDLKMDYSWLENLVINYDERRLGI